MLMVLLALATNLVGARILSESLRRRVEYGETNSVRWAEEFEKYSKVGCPWPFTCGIERTGRWIRVVKAIFTIVSGAILIVGAIVK